MTAETEQLKAKVKAVCSYKTLADYLNWPYQRVNQKLNGVAIMRPEEAQDIKDALKNIKGGV